MSAGVEQRAPSSLMPAVRVDAQLAQAVADALRDIPLPVRAADGRLLLRPRDRLSEPAGHVVVPAELALQLLTLERVATLGLVGRGDKS